MSLLNYIIRRFFRKKVILKMPEKYGNDEDIKRPTKNAGLFTIMNT